MAGRGVWCLIPLVWLVASPAFCRRSTSERDLLYDSPDDFPICHVSVLGYQCSRKVCGGITLHWTLGGEAPSGTCKYTGGTAANSSGALDASATVMHMALQTDLKGYVALSWPKTQGEMTPADGVIGWVDQATGEGDVQPYFIKKMSKDPANAVQVEAAVTLHHTGALVDVSGLTVCFSRDKADVGAAGIAVSLLASVPMNFAAAPRRAPGKELGMHVATFDTDHLCSPLVMLVAGRTAGPDEGGDGNGDAEGRWDAYITLHGVLMIVVWAVLIPAGILAARHKQLLQYSDSSRQPKLWFQVHRVVQAVAAGLFYTAFILPFQTFTRGMDLSSEGWVMKVHAYLAILLTTALSTHLMIAFFRPKPDHPSRPLWNRIHWWAGRSMPLVAAANLFVGIAINNSEHGASLGVWLGCLIPLLVAVVAAVVYLERQRAVAGAPRSRDKHSFGSVDDDDQELASILGNSTGYSSLA